MVRICSVSKTNQLLVIHVEHRTDYWQQSSHLIRCRVSRPRWKLFFSFDGLCCENNISCCSL